MTARIIYLSHIRRKGDINYSKWYKLLVQVTIKTERVQYIKVECDLNGIPRIVKTKKFGTLET